MTNRRFNNLAEFLASARGSDPSRPCKTDTVEEIQARIDELDGERHAPDCSWDVREGGRLLACECREGTDAEGAG